MAIYTLINNSQFHSLLSYYDIGRLINYSPIQAGTTNSNYEFIVNYHNETYKYVLTIIEQKLSKSELVFCLEYVSLLHSSGLPVANPIKDRHGLNHRIFLEKPVIITPFLSGVSLTHEQNIDSHYCGYMGLAAGNMHLVGMQSKLQRKNPADLNWCHKTWELIKDLVPTDYVLLIKDELKYLTSNSMLIEGCSLPKGAIHADLFMDNVLFNHHRLEGIIDFFYACTDYFLYDLAIIVNDWAIDSQAFLHQQHYSTLITNYISTLKKDATAYDNLFENLNAHENIWQFFLRLAALRFLLLRLNAKYLPTDSHIKTVKDPNEFKLKLLFHRENKLELEDTSNI